MEELEVFLAGHCDQKASAISRGILSYTLWSPSSRVPIYSAFVICIIKPQDLPHRFPAGEPVCLPGGRQMGGYQAPLGYVAEAFPVPGYIPPAYVRGCVGGAVVYQDDAEVLVCLMHRIQQVKFW